jgi:2-haloacid dehalogenase
MKYVLAYDVYGTLIDPAGVRVLLTEMVGERAGAFSNMWRDKQLEYSFRRGLMGSYVDFSVCTSEALEYTCTAANTALSKAQKAALLARYTELPAYPDAAEGLSMASSAGHRCFAFSNGSHEAVAKLLQHSGLSRFFEGIVSAESVETFKPNPAVYAHFCAAANTEKAHAVLVSGNPFDVIGAIHFGMKAIWIKRDSAPTYDPWGIGPDAEAVDLMAAARVVHDLGK